MKYLGEFRSRLEDCDGMSDESNLNGCSKTTQASAYTIRPTKSEHSVPMINT